MEKRYITLIEKQFEERLRKIRIRANLTQQDVADRLHITRQSSSKWEKNISLSLLSIINELTIIFSCTLDELFYEVDNKEVQ